jgi:hypothetical protein
VLAVIAGAGMTRPCPAQTPLQLIPHVGMWLPVGIVQEDRLGEHVVQRAQVGELLVGGRAGLTLSRVVAVEGSVGWSPTQVALTDSSGTTDIPGTTLLANARVSFVGRLSQEFAGSVGAGVGLVRRTGRGWDRPHSAAAIVTALGVQSDLGPGTAFRMEFEIYASRGTRRTAPGGAPPQESWRADLAMSFGVVIRPRDR